MILLLFIFSCLLSSSFNVTSTVANITSDNFLSNIVGSFIRGRNGINITRFLSTFQLPACMEQCVPEIDGLLTAISKNNNDGEFVDVCSELQSASYCASSAGCSKIFTEALASAFQFICLDNIQAISESIQCVKIAAMDSQSDCEVHCSVNSPPLDKTSNSGLEEIFQIQRVCNSTRCLLKCFKTKIDNKCQLGERNLLDTLLSAVIRGGYYGTENTFEWIMPESCQIKSTYKDLLNYPEMTSFSVGKVAHRSFADVENTEAVNNETEYGIEATSTEASENFNATDALLLVDGEIRTLRYQMFDWQGNPVPNPDLETLFKILADHFFSVASTTEPSVDSVVLLTELREKTVENGYNTIAAFEEQKKEADSKYKSSERNVKINKNQSEVVRIQKTSQKKPTKFSKKFASLISPTILTLTIFSWIWELAQNHY